MLTKTVGIVFVGLLSACSSAPISIKDFERPAVGTCIAGNCVNGYGTLRYPGGDERTGNRVNGRTYAGTYEYRYACYPNKTFTQMLDNAEHILGGTSVRCGNGFGFLEQGGRLSFYSGTFSLITNPFTQEQTPAYKTGVYTDGSGVKWEGEFEYIPFKYTIDGGAAYGKVNIRKGSFIFLGAKIDEQLDEVSNGLFISEPTSPGWEIVFSKARPDYLASLRANFVDNSTLDAEARSADARASREMFSKIIGFASVAVAVYGANKLATASSNRTAMDSLANVMRGQKSPVMANAELPRANTSNAPARPLTVAQYRNQQSGGSNSTQAAVTPSAPIPAANEAERRTREDDAIQSERIQPAQQTQNSSRPTGFTPRVVNANWTTDGISKGQTDAWCAKWTKQIRDDFQGTKNELISIKACSCKLGGSLATKLLQPEYICGFDYTYRQNVPDFTAR